MNSPRRLTPVVLSLLALLLAFPGAAGAAEPAWRAEQPPPPPGFPFAGPLGIPGDIAFWAPNRGLMTVAGNGAYRQGVLVYDGSGWRQLATVCGADGERGGAARIAWAGPTEFWTIARPSALQTPTNEGAVTLCRFAGGKVAASYASLQTANERWPALTAAACRSATDCWFAGPVATTVDGARSGAFHLRWDGGGLNAVYAPQGRAVNDLLADGDGYLEATTVGPAPLAPAPAAPAPAEPVPLLLHRVVGADITTDPFTPLPRDDTPPDGSELLALDGDGDRVWAGGGQATSGPNALVFSGGRPPLLVRREGAGPFEEVPIPDDAFLPGESIVDVAVEPGRDRVWAAVAEYPPSPDSRAKVARVAADGTVERVDVLPQEGPARGAAARIDCPAVDDCWMVTVAGYVFHLGGGALERDTDPAFASVITTRPPDGRTPQFTPDALPVDDSQRFAPPPPAEQQAPQTPATRRLPRLLRIVRAGLKRGTLRYELRIRLARRARVGLIAERRVKRGGRTRTVVVARTRTRTLRPGAHTLRLQFRRDRWPTRLRFALRELDQRLAAPPSDDAVSVPTTGSAARR
jgi:hypothetical protein